MAIAIKVQNVSKAYRLGVIGTGTVSNDLKRWYARTRGKEDPFLKIGETNDRTTKGTSDIVWSLKDISFEIEQGDAVGIIGRNGAGKSTLLKILSRVTSPTTGRISGNGRVASLLEVGTGFNPELTGKDNIYLNGAILGMRKKEIKRKFDAIVDFAGVERYIDTPVKRYSSGMYVRLAFAVAAYLESEILIVDEVLAVGDAEFQNKCIGKMGEVTNGEGRTVLFVSHNMIAIQKLCKTAMFLNNGLLISMGGTESIIDEYLRNATEQKTFYNLPLPEAKNDLFGYAYELQIEDNDGSFINEIPIGKNWQVRIRFKLNKETLGFVIGLGIVNSAEINIRTTWSKKVNLAQGYYEAVFKEDLIFYAPGRYYLTVGLSSLEKPFYYEPNIASITISDTLNMKVTDTLLQVKNVGILLNPMNVKILSNNNQSDL